MSQQLTFYTNPMSRGRIARWMLEETGIEYETKILDYNNNSMKSAEYLAINPMGKVPAIKHGDTIVTEAAAICAYLADTFKEADLAPITSKERGAYYRWLFFASGPLEQAVALRMLEITIPHEKERQLGCGNPQVAIDTLAKAVSVSPYIAGDRFTAADVYVGSHIGWGMQFGTLDKRPEFISYWERLSSRNAKIRADEKDNALVGK